MNKKYIQKIAVQLVVRVFVFCDIGRKYTGIIKIRL